MTNPDPQHGAALTPQEQIAWQAIAQRISERTAYCEAEEAFPRLLAALTQAEGERDALELTAVNAQAEAAQWRENATGWRDAYARVVRKLNGCERPDEATQPPLPDAAAPQQLGLLEDQS